MNAIKRKFIECHEILSFTAFNNFEIERYFSPKKLIFENNLLNLWFDHSYNTTPKSITIEAIYLDASKHIKKYENIEFIETFEIPLPKEGIWKHNEFAIPIKIIENTKVLWKIKFKIKSKTNCDFHVSLN